MAKHLNSSCVAQSIAGVVSPDGRERSPKSDQGNNSLSRPTSSLAAAKAVSEALAFYSAELDVLSYVVKRLFGLAIFGRVYGFIFAVFQLGAALGATLLPLSRTHWGGYGPGLMIYAVTLLVSAVLLLRLGSSIATVENKTGKPDASLRAED